MKTWVLITTILLSTPEKDYSGVVIHEFDNEIACDIELKKSKNVNILFIDTSSTARNSELWAKCLTLTKTKSESA